MSNRLLHVIADYAPGDLAFSEMVSALTACLPAGYTIWPTTMKSFDTIGTGFCIAQLALGDESKRPRDMLIYANCAPRKDLPKARENNQGEKLVYGVLRNGVRLVAVNSGHSLSFVREELDQLWTVNVDHGGSQFRSRDIFPPVVGLAATGEVKDILREEIDTSNIPERPRGVVVYTDSFGNLKTSYRAGDEEVESLKSGQRVDVIINGVPRPAVVSTGNFNVREGETAFAPGSSGFDRRYWEIFLRGGDASEAFRNPKPGTPVTIEIPGNGAH